MSSDERTAVIQFNIDSRSRSRSDDRSQCNIQIENTTPIYDNVFADGDGLVTLCARGLAKITGFIIGVASVCWLVNLSSCIVNTSHNTIFYINIIV